MFAWDATKQRRLEALRSDKYKKECGRLRGEIGYCIQGVMCDVSGLGSWKRGSGHGGYWYVLNGVEDVCNYFYAPWEVVQHYGITDVFLQGLASICKLNPCAGFHDVLDHMESYIDQNLHIGGVGII